MSDCEHWWESIGCFENDGVVYQIFKCPRCSICRSELLEFLEDKNV